MMRMICIGNQTACWAATPLDPFEYALTQNFNAFEWFPDKKPGAGWDESDLQDGVRQDITKGRAPRDAALRPCAVAGQLARARFLSAGLERPGASPGPGRCLLNVHLFHEQGIAAFVEALLPLIRRTAEAGCSWRLRILPIIRPINSTNSLAA